MGRRRRSRPPARGGAADRLPLRRRLDHIVTAPEFRDALFVASPSLADAGSDVAQGTGRRQGPRRGAVPGSYFLRAAARPTPFGLFAGYTTGSVGPRTHLCLDGLASYRRHTRLDMDYLWALADAVERDPRLRRDLRYRPNSSLYQIGDRLLFAEARPGRADGTGRSYRLVAVGATPYLMQTLARARDGVRLDARPPRRRRRDHPGGRGGLPRRARPQPGPGGRRPAAADRRRAGEHDGGGPETARGYGRFRAPGAGSGRRPRRDRRRRRRGAAEPYRAAAAVLHDLPVSPEPSRFAQVDLAKLAARFTLGAQVTVDLLRGTEILHDLTATVRTRASASSASSSPAATRPGRCRLRRPWTRRTASGSSGQAPWRPRRQGRRRC